MGKKTFICIFSLVFIILFVFLDIPFLLRLSFIINFVFLWIITYYNIFIEKKFSPFLGVFVVFNLLFFIVAPLIQIDSIVTKGYDSGGKYIQHFPFSEGSAIRGNFYILFFNLIFFISYLYYRNKTYQRKIKYKIPYKNTPAVLLILAIITFLIVVVNKDTIVFQYQNDFYKEVEQTSVANYMMVQKFLFFIPMGGVILSYFYLKTHSKDSKNYPFVIFFLVYFLFVVILLKNPLTEKRNALGPIYITLIFLFYKKILDDNYKVVRFMFFSMVLLFPILTIFTHSRNSMSQMIARPYILIENIKYLHVTDAFNSLHYDAYPNFLATIDFCDRKTVTYGEQLEPTLFFFVPRGIWHSKPEVTGFKIGNYLIDRYGFNFKNLSNPYVSEAYINFGLFGIALFAFVLAILFGWLIRWLAEEDRLKSLFAFYTAIYLMYFLRGDLANGFAFIVAAFMAIILVPKVLYLLVNHYARK